MIADIIARYIPAPVRKAVYLGGVAVLGAEQALEAKGIDLIPNMYEEILVTVVATLSGLLAASMTTDIVVVAEDELGERSI